MTKRLFLAIPLPPDLLDKLDNWQREYKKQYQIKWVPKENLHITLAFLGDIAEDKISLLANKLAEVLFNFSYFELSFAKIMLFPPHHSSMIWANYVTSKEFINLTANIWQAVKEFISPEILQPKKSPQAHITLARFRYPVFIKNLKQIDYPNQVPVNKILLMESELTASRPYYKIIKEFELKA